MIHDGGNLIRANNASLVIHNEICMLTQKGVMFYVPESRFIYIQFSDN